MEFTTLQHRPDLTTQLINLIEDNFNYSEEHSFETDFLPLLEFNKKNLYMVVDGDTVIAHVGLLPKTLKLNGYHPIAFLGGIVTRKEYQGQGISSKLLEFVIKRNEEHYSLFTLWSDLVDFYKKFDFHLAGGLIHGETHEGEAKYSFKKTKFNELSDDDFAQVQFLYQQSVKSYSHLVRSAQHWNTIRKMSSIDLFLLKEKEQIKGYYLQNKGQDLKTVIFEYACDEDIVKADFFQSMKDGIAWLPECEKQYFTHYTQNYLGLFRISNPNLFAILVKDFSNGLIEAVVDKDQVHFSFNGQTYNALKAEFLTYLFGPNRLKEFEGMSRPLFISGIESI